MFENSFPPSARPTKCDAQMPESNYKTRSNTMIVKSIS
ncbi:DUF6783 domain-containing protein [Robinsoniella peoriensis]